MQHGRYKYCKYCETDTMNNAELFTWFEYYTQVKTKKYGPYYYIKCIKCGINGAYYRTEKGKQKQREFRKKYRARKENKIKQAKYHRKWVEKNKGQPESWSFVKKPYAIYDRKKFGKQDEFCWVPFEDIEKNVACIKIKHKKI